MNKSMTELRSVTWHTGSHSVACYPSQVSAPRLNASHAGRYTVYLPRRDGRLSWRCYSETQPPGVELASSRSRIQRPNHWATEQHSLYITHRRAHDWKRRTWKRRTKWQDMKLQDKNIYTVSGKKDPQSSVNNFNTLKHIFTIFRHTVSWWYVLLTHVKFAFKIYLSLCSFDVIMTSSKSTFKFVIAISGRLGFFPDTVHSINGDYITMQFF